MVVSVSTDSSVAELYKGHKVVVMPSGDEIGLKSPTWNADNKTTSPYRRRSRGRSTERSPVSRSRDIVQDVYDRMGVNYTRGRSSIDSLVEDNAAKQPKTRPSALGLTVNVPDEKTTGVSPRNAQVSPRNSQMSPRNLPVSPRNLSASPRNVSVSPRHVPASPTNSIRGRSDSFASNGERRCRSLSRGRIANRWPPAQASSTPIVPTPTPIVPTPTPVVHNPRKSTAAPVHSANPVSSSVVDLSALKDVSQTSAHSMERSSYLQSRRSLPHPLAISKSFQAEESAVVSTTETRDEGDEEEVERNEVTRDIRENPLSVKDRISAYGPVPKTGQAARNARRSFNSQFGKRTLPPRGETLTAPSVDLIVDPTEATVSTMSVGASEAHVLNKGRLSSGNSATHRSSKSGGVADAFLAAISPNKVTASPPVSKNITVVEFPSEALDAAPDGVSLAPSSVSGEDFVPSPKNQIHNRKSSFPSKYSPLPRKSITDQNISTMTVEKLERIIQDRVKSAVKGMEADFRKLEERMENEYQTRLKELERKTDKVNSILSKIVSKNLPEGRLEI